MVFKVARQQAKELLDREFERTRSLLSDELGRLIDENLNITADLKAAHDEISSLKRRTTE